MLDYSPASVAGWQWVAGCGADAHRTLEYLIQFYRVRNLIKKEYVKKWVPELKKLSKKFIHKPWEFNDEKFTLGKDYPYPIVKHEEARAKALNAFKKI